jgi:glutathione S-transferase
MNASPFCMKVEVFLKLAGLPYTVNDHTLPMRLPKGKLPALRDGDTLVCDSQTILEHLQQHHADRLPPALRQAASGTDHALRRMVEEHLYFAMLWLRWIDDTGFAATAPAFFGALPWPLRALLPPLVRRKMRRDLVGQGMGRHAADEIAARARADLDAAQALLAARPFFGGDEPGAIDATLYAFLANVLFVEIDSPVRRHLQAMAPLVAYCERLQARVGR